MHNYTTCATAVKSAGECYQYMILASQVEAKSKRVAVKCPDLTKCPVDLQIENQIA